MHQQFADGLGGTQHCHPRLRIVVSILTLLQYLVHNVRRFVLVILSRYPLVITKSTGDRQTNEYEQQSSVFSDQ